MKLKTIEINNYKAFYGAETFNVDGKNLFIYGENGSGKSSFYYAMKDFFQSAKETINFDDVENMFLTTKQKGKAYIKVTFNPNKDGNNIDQIHQLKKGSNNTYGDIQIRDAIYLKSFLTYKNLLGIHYLKHHEEIDLFDLLVKGVLKHFKSVAVTGSKELGELWQDVEDACAKEIEGRTYNRSQKERDVKAALGTFNSAFVKLFRPDDSPEKIIKYAQPILDKFGHNIEIDLNYTQAVPNARLDGVERNHVRINVKYLGKLVPKPHIFLNEARLSAIAISIYLGMIKRHIQGIPCKILFLDDIFIGLDIGNRLPLMEILKSEFPAYQIFITTYDKPWYEFIKFYLDNDPKWKCFELYARRTRKGFEIPIIIENKSNSNIQNMIDRADAYFNTGDNKAAGVYLRSAFEFILKKTCKNRNIPVAFKLSISDLTTEDLWLSLKNYEANLPAAKQKLTPGTISSIEHYRKLVLNPLSHHDVNKHEITAEIQGAIATIKNLKSELGV